MNPKRFEMLAVLLIIAIFSGCSKRPKDKIPVHQTFNIVSVVLQEERKINVYVPANYQTDQDLTFPILFMPDGGLKEDFCHLVNTARQLIADKQIAPLIIVGVENTARRRDMTPPTRVNKDKNIAPVIGGSAKFRAFFQEELMPAIEARYRGNGTKGIIGESLAGLFVMESFFESPKMFNAYIALSPSVWWDAQKLVRDSSETLKRHKGLATKLYFASANEKDIYLHTDTLAQTLETHAPSDLDWVYNPRRDLKHSNIYRTVSAEALKSVFGISQKRTASKTDSTL